MGSDLTADLSEQLRTALAGGLTDEATKDFQKKVRNLTIEIDTALEYHFQDVLVPGLVGFVEAMAKRTVEAILQGNENEMRRYLGCERNAWTGRSDSPYFGKRDRIEDWHPVIRGNLFETGAIALREKIVSAHRELIASERVLDLEDQVRSLVAQVNKASAERESLAERLREYTR